MLATRMAAARGPILAFGAAALGASVVAIMGGPAAPSQAAWTARLVLVFVSAGLLFLSVVARENPR